MLNSQPDSVSAAQRSVTQNSNFAVIPPQAIGQTSLISNDLAASLLPNNPLTAVRSIFDIVSGLPERCRGYVTFAKYYPFETSQTLFGIEKISRSITATGTEIVGFIRRTELTREQFDKLRPVLWHSYAAASHSSGIVLVRSLDPRHPEAQIFIDPRVVGTNVDDLNFADIGNDANFNLLRPTRSQRRLLHEFSRSIGRGDATVWKRLELTPTLPVGRHEYEMLLDAFADGRSSSPHYSGPSKYWGGGIDGVLKIGPAQLHICGLKMKLVFGKKLQRPFKLTREALEVPFAE